MQTSRTLALSASLAILVGWVHFEYMVKIIFYYWVTYSNFQSTLIEIGLRGIAFYTASIMADYVVATVFSIPTAFILNKLKPNRVWLYVSLAVLPIFLLFQLVPLWKNPSSYIEHLPGSMMGWVNLLLPIPSAMILIQRFGRLKPPNKSLNADTGDAGAG